jgi:hypothetical protein
VKKIKLLIIIISIGLSFSPVEIKAQAKSVNKDNSTIKAKSIINTNSAIKAKSDIPAADQEILKFNQKIDYRDYIENGEIFSLITAHNFGTEILPNISEQESKLMENSLANGELGSLLSSSPQFKTKLKQLLRSKPLSIQPLKESNYDFRYNVCSTPLVRLYNQKKEDLESFISTNKVSEEIYKPIYDFWWEQLSPINPKIKGDKNNFSLQFQVIRNWNNYFKKLSSNEKKKTSKVVYDILSKLEKLKIIENTIILRCASFYTDTNKNEATSSIDYLKLSLNQRASRSLYLQLPTKNSKEIIKNSYKKETDLKDCEFELNKFCPNHPATLTCLYENYRSLNKDCQTRVFALHKFELNLYKKEGIRLNFLLTAKEYGELSPSANLNSKNLKLNAR